MKANASWVSDIPEVLHYLEFFHKNSAVTLQINSSVCFKRLPSAFNLMWNSGCTCFATSKMLLMMYDLMWALSFNVAALLFRKEDGRVEASLCQTYLSECAFH